MPLYECFQARPTTCNDPNINLETFNRNFARWKNCARKNCEAWMFQTSRYIMCVCVCVSGTIRRNVRYRKGEKDGKDVTFPLSLLSASHAALINLVRLFRDGRKRAARRRSRRMEEEEEGGNKGEAGRCKWRGDLISIRRRIVALPPSLWGIPRR